MDELSEIFSAQSTEANPVLLPNTSMNMNLLEPTQAESLPGKFILSFDCWKNYNFDSV